MWLSSCVLFFQAEDGIRDYKVTGVQTCAPPIWPPVRARCSCQRSNASRNAARLGSPVSVSTRARRTTSPAPRNRAVTRSEERRVGKECRYRCAREREADRIVDADTERPKQILPA